LEYSGGGAGAAILAEAFPRADAHGRAIGAVLVFGHGEKGRGGRGGGAGDVVVGGTGAGATAGAEEVGVLAWDDVPLRLVIALGLGEVMESRIRRRKCTRGFALKIRWRSIVALAAGLSRVEGFPCALVEVGRLDKPLY